MKKRHIYIDNQPKEEANARYQKLVNLKATWEVVAVEASLHRVSYEAVYAGISSPHYHGSAMDGIAVVASTTFDASETNPIVLEEGIDFDYVNTGNPIPIDKDAVIMIEDVDPCDDNKIQIIKPAYPWQHVRPVGEDIVKGEMIIPSKHKIRPMDIGALMCGGITEIKVIQKTKVGILPTGNEIIRDTSQIKPGAIIDSNSRMFEGLVSEAGGMATVYEPVIDDPNLLKEAILKGVAENDLFVINAGSSAGSKDYTADIIRELGEVVVHGIAIKPGKPTILGLIQGKAVIGIPGYPVSAYFSFKTFVDPMIRKANGLPIEVIHTQATLSRRVVSSLKHEELVRVTLGEVDGKIIATPLNRGAGNTMSLVRADGVLTLPRNVEGIDGGKVVDIQLTKTIDAIKASAVFIGSHDVTIDIIADLMPVSSAHVGSLGGILAMRKGECHIAPIHLLDIETGTYNDPIVRKYFPQGHMSIISGLKRLQGLMVQKGNPKSVKGFEDLVREDIIFVNRQRGAGTRQLLDYELASKSIDSEQIMGYQREMNTHMAVAVAVESGGADVGLGTLSAAKAMDLDFIPVGFESYEFLVADKTLEDPRIKKFIEVLQSEVFKERVLALGGYEIEAIGQIRKVGDQNDG